MPFHDICVPDVLYGNADNRISDTFDVNNACGPICRNLNGNFVDINCVDVLLCCLTAEPVMDCNCIRVTAIVDVVFEEVGVANPRRIVVQRTLTQDICRVGPFTPGEECEDSNFGAENLRLRNVIDQIDGVCVTITNLDCVTDPEGVTDINLDYTLKLWKHNNLVVDACIPGYAQGEGDFDTITVTNDFNAFGPCAIPVNGG